MATCAACGTTILFGGSEVQGRRVCNAKCAAAMNEALAKETVPEAAALERAQAIRTGSCPKCNSAGLPPPADRDPARAPLHLLSRRHQPLFAHAPRLPFVWQQAADFASRSSRWSPVGGDFPGASSSRPVPIGRNISGMFAAPSVGPSPELVSAARAIIAREQGKLPA